MESLRAYLKEIFQSMDNQGIRYCVFRNQDQLEYFEKNKEIDILVDRDHLKNLKSLLNKKGFVQIPSWGFAPHHFFVSYLRNLGMWLKFDVIDHIRFGKPISMFQISFTKNFLDNRKKSELAYNPSQADEFFVLLLKFIINDSVISEKRLNRLLELFEVIQADNTLLKQLIRNFKEYFHSVFSWPELSEFIEKQKWQSISSKHAVVVRHLFFKNPLAVIYRYISVRFSQILSPVLYILLRKGISVALLAPDGAGKSGLAKNLRNHKYINSKIIYMGENVESSNIGLPTTAWFKRIKKSNPNNLSFFIKVVVKIFNFPNQLAEQWYRTAVGIYHRLRGRFVIFDRYVYDSYLNPPCKKIHKKIRRFLVEKSCPSPDIVILLDAPGNILYRRKAEHTPEWLEDKRQGYLKLKSHLSNMIVIDAMRKEDEVCKEVTSIIWNYYRTRNLEKAVNGNRG